MGAGTICIPSRYLLGNVHHQRFISSKFLLGSESRCVSKLRVFCGHLYHNQSHWPLATHWHQWSGKISFLSPKTSTVRAKKEPINSVKANNSRNHPQSQPEKTAQAPLWQMPKWASTSRWSRRSQGPVAKQNFSVVQTVGLAGPGKSQKLDGRPPKRWTTKLY